MIESLSRAYPRGPDVAGALERPPFGEPEVARSAPVDPLSRFVDRVKDLPSAELEREAARLTEPAVAELVRRAARESSPAIERVLRHRLTAVARTFTGKLYFAGAATVSVDDDNHDGEPDYLPDRTYQRTSSLFFGALGRETNVDDFALWIRGEGKKPGSRGKMNCWEAVLLMAHESGILSRERLFEIYDDAARVGREAHSQSAYFRALGDALGLDRAVASTEPQAGDIVFFQSNLGYGGMEHVALALGTVDKRGRHEILSLWQLPAGAFGFKSHLQKTTIEELVEQAERLGGIELHAKVAPMPFVPRQEKVVTPDLRCLPTDEPGCRPDTPTRVTGVWLRRERGQTPGPARL